MKKIICLVSTILVLMTSPAMSAESVFSELVEGSLRDALIEHGISPLEASELSSRYAFIGSMMTSSIRRGASEGAGEALDNISDAGAALGSAIGVMINVYGRADLQELVSVMLLTSRAGIAPKITSQLFAAAAYAGHDVESALKILGDTAETFRQLQANDLGMSIAAMATEMIEGGSDAAEISERLASIWKAEHERRKLEIAVAEAERRRLDSRGNDSDSSSGADRGGFASSGGSSSGDPSGASSSGGDVSSASGSDGSSSSGADAGGGSDAGAGAQESGDPSGSAGAESAGESGESSDNGESSENDEKATTTE